MKNKVAFTLVELIVVITILAILGTIAFISLNNFSASARDTKRLSDVRSLYTKFTLENAKGVRYSSLVKDVITSEMQINGEMVVIGQGVPNFETLKERRENFLDPTTNTDYPVGFYENGLILASTTDIQGIPSMIQVATYSEENNEAVVVGNFITSGDNADDTKGLIKGEDGEILINDNPTIIPGQKRPNGITISGGGTDKNNFTWQDLTLTYDGVSHTIMDRNLGATEIYNGIEKSETWGNHYQWGNNYGFPSFGEVKTSNTPVETASRPYESDIFVFGTGASFDWVQNQNNDLWGGETEGNEAKKGPCPTGRHIPSNLEWNGLINTWFQYRSNGATFCSVATGDTCSWLGDMTLANLKFDLKMPSGGWRSGNNALLSGGGIYSQYWSSSPYVTKAYFLSFESRYFLSNLINYRRVGYSIRCFKN